MQQHLPADEPVTRPDRARRRFRRTALVLALSAVAGAAMSQSASQLSERDFQPPRTPLTGSLSFSGQPGLDAPPGAERLSILIRDVEVEGSLPGLEDEAEVLAARLTRGRIPVSEIFEAATALEADYAEAGYVLARVVLPAQELRDGGTLRIVVVDGFVETIDTSTVPDSIRGRVTALTGPLEERRGLTLSEIERRLLLAGDTYGVALGSALSAGSQPGGTVIILDPAYRPVTGFVGVNNRLPDSVGTWSLDAGIELNSTLGFGEVVYARLSGNPESLFSADPAMRTLALGAVVPVGPQGLTFNLEGSRSDARRSGVTPVSFSRYERLSARLYYPWVRSRSRNLTTQLSFDATEDRLWIDTVAGDIGIYEDRLRVLRLAGDGFWMSEGGATTEVGAILSRGIDAGGARSAAEATAALPLSRAGADADFTKLELSARHRRTLGEALVFTVNGRAQTSFGDPLAVSEQFAVATAQDLSAFETGTLSGDSGWVLRTELAYPVGEAATGLPVDLSPYLFAAAGAVMLEAPQAGEPGTTQAQSFGLGLDVFYAADPQFSNGSLRLEVGRGMRDDGQPDETRFSLTGNFRF